MLDGEVRRALVGELQAALPEQVVLDVATLLYLAKRL
jgi:hypothetical protein